MASIEYRLPQERRIVTAFPGPASTALAARRKAVVGSGVASTLPVYVADADGERDRLGSLLRPLRRRCTREEKHAEREKRYQTRLGFHHGLLEKRERTERSSSAGRCRKSIRARTGRSS